MTLTQLKYILAVERCHNFAQAARECFVTQPTLSMQIHKLEDYLQVTVFDRSAQPTRPTALGQKVLDMAREVVRRSDALEDLAKSVRNEIAGEYNLGVIPTLAPSLVPLFVGAFEKRFPKVQLRVYEHQTETLIQLLKEDKLDGGLCAGPLGVKGLHEEPLFWEPFELMFSAGHELLKDKEVREDKLRIEDAWLLREGHCLRTQVLQLCQPRHGGERGLQFEGGSLETLVNLLRTMPGFTVLPELTVAALSTEDRRRVRPFKGATPVREVQLVTGPFAVRASITAALVGCIKDSVPKELLRKEKRANVMDAR
jgi:LysR family hydrogen peroxide-inducible transcriptional activator